MESSPVIQTMLRIGNIQLSKGEVKKALDCFSEVSGVLENDWLHRFCPITNQVTNPVFPLDIGHWICE